MLYFVFTFIFFDPNMPPPELISKCIRIRLDAKCCVTLSLFCSCFSAVSACSCCPSRDGKHARNQQRREYPLSSRHIIVGLHGSSLTHQHLMSLYHPPFTSRFTRTVFLLFGRCVLCPHNPSRCS